MIFKGITPSIRYVDPEFFRFELRLHWQYLAVHFIEFKKQMIQAFSNFGTIMQKTAESIRRISQIINKED